MNQKYTVAKCMETFRRGVLKFMEAAPGRHDKREKEGKK